MDDQNLGRLPQQEHWRRVVRGALRSGGRHGSQRSVPELCKCHQREQSDHRRAFLVSLAQSG
eukprot:360469-Chlamydomonas_euryale.AAC.3